MRRTRSRLPVLALRLGLLVALGGGLAAQAPESAGLLETALASITPEDCRSRVEILAGPEMEGRDSGSPGFERAARWVEERLEELGLEPAGPEGSWRVPYTVAALQAGPGASIAVVDRKGEETLLEPGRDFLPLPGSALEEVEGEPLFVGYAIDARSERWQDLPESRVQGRVVFAFSREPRADNPKNRTFDGAEPTRYSQLRTKAEAVRKAGGVALVLVPDPGAFPEASAPLPGHLPVVVRRGFDPANRRLQLPVPVFSVSREAAGRLFDEDLERYHQGIDRRHKPKHLRAPRGTRVRLRAELVVEELRLYNLAARIPGTRPETGHILLGAHLDHVGYEPLGFSPTGGMQVVHPGADDNASGSSALLEVAEAFAGTSPQTTLLFLWFSGEEKGLLGSFAYTREPLLPLKEAVCMLNMDMVGMGPEHSMNIGGVWDRPAWARLLREQRKRAGLRLRLDLESGRDLYARSDQFPFYRAGLPALFFFEGDLDSNPVYHQPGDRPERINAEKMSAVARLFAATVHALAFDGVRPDED